jgi:phage shock protein B
MSDNVTAIICCAILFLGPVWLTFRFLDRGRRHRTLGAQDVAAIAQLSSVAARMETRMAALEAILDQEAPAWRARSL